MSRAGGDHTQPIHEGSTGARWHDSPGWLPADTDPSLRQVFRDAIKARIDWAPDEPEFHFFSVDIHQAAFIRFGGGQRTMIWDPRRGLRKRLKEH